MAKRVKEDVRRYAVVGAEQRLLEIAEEAARIFRVFPELRERGRGLDAVRDGRSEADTAGQKPGRRRRRRMSAEARRKISQAQKARWARQKAGRKAG